MPLTDGREIRARLEHQIDAVLDSGNCGLEPTTVVDLAVSPPVILRQGRGRLPGLRRRGSLRRTVRPAV